MHQTLFYKPSIALEDHLLYGNVHILLRNGQIKPFTNGQVTVFAYNDHIGHTITDQYGHYYLLFSFPTSFGARNYTISNDNHLHQMFSFHINQDETMKSYSHMQIYNYTIETMQKSTMNEHIYHSTQNIWRTMIVMHESSHDNPFLSSEYHEIWICLSLISILGWILFYCLWKNVYKEIQRIPHQETKQAIQHKRIGPIRDLKAQNKANYQVEGMIYKSSHLKCVLMDDNMGKKNIY